MRWLAVIQEFPGFQQYQMAKGSVISDREVRCVCLDRLLNGCRHSVDREVRQNERMIIVTGKGGISPRTGLFRLYTQAAPSQNDREVRMASGPGMKRIFTT